MDEPVPATPATDKTLTIAPRQDSFKYGATAQVIWNGLVVLGVGLELAQSVISNRDGSIYDALANFVGVATGFVAMAGTKTFLRDL